MDECHDILVVEDDPRVARALASLLNEAGFATVVFHAGLPVIDYLQRSVPAAAIIDIHLPDLSGLVLTSKLRERLGPDRPIIVLSGDTSMETLNSLTLLGATYFFSKPCNFDDLREKLKQLTARSAGPDRRP